MFLQSSHTHIKLTALPEQYFLVLFFVIPLRQRLTVIPIDQQVNPLDPIRTILTVYSPFEILGLLSWT